MHDVIVQGALPAGLVETLLEELAIVERRPQLTHAFASQPMARAAVFGVQAGPSLDRPGLAGPCTRGHSRLFGTTDRQEKR